MAYKLEIKAFFFNSKTDYLPYYKNFTIKIDGTKTAKELLIQINECNENFSFPKQKLVFKINNLVVQANEKIENIVNKLGTELKIDPVNEYRSLNGLKIDDSDFMKSFDLLSEWTTEDDLKYYKTLYAIHYASESEKFSREYIGDAILLLAHKMITDGSEHEEEILKVITSVNSGLMDAEFENNLFNAQDHTNAINELKNMVHPPQGPSLLAKLMHKFINSNDSMPKREVVTVENLENKHVAYYAGSCSNSLVKDAISNSAVREIIFSRSHKLSGDSLMQHSKNMAMQKAGATLLDAFDSGAEVLVVEDINTLDMFNKEFKHIENSVGRKIRLELISSEDFLKQTS